MLATVATFGFGADTARLLAAFRALGCRTCQFYREEGYEITASEARRIVDRAGLRFDSVHGVFGEHIDPSSPDRAERERCLRIYEDEGRLALDLGGPEAGAVVVHPAHFNPGRRMMDPDEADAAQTARWPALDDFLVRLAEMGERLGVTYLIENQPRNSPVGHDPGALAEHIRAAGSARIRMCLDTGHAHMTGDAAAAIRAGADVIEYLHIHDNDGAADTHLMPGDGTIRWENGVGDALHGLGGDAPRMLEVFYEPGRLERLAAEGFANRLRELLGLPREGPAP